MDNHTYKLEEGTYREYKIPKRSGGYRKIVAPDKDLLKYQRNQLPSLITYFKKQIRGTVAANTVHGFIPNHNCVTGAQMHIGYTSTTMMDITNFFDSVTKEMLPEHIANDGSLWHLNGYAAQGLATSPILANIAILPALFQIHELLDDIFEDYALTIYADDIQISHNSEDYDDINEIIEGVTAIIENSGFSINANKTRTKYAKHGWRRILGVNVGDSTTRASRKTMRKLRAAKHQGNGPSAGGLSTWSKNYLPKMYKPTK